MAEAQKKAKGGKKNRKYGRNARWCAAYRLRNQREHNKLTRLARHLARYPRDSIAKLAVVRVREVLGMRAAA